MRSWRSFLTPLMFLSLFALPAATMAQTNNELTASISPSGPINMVNGQVIELTGSGNDPGGGTVNLAWTLTDDNDGTVDAADATLTAANTDGTKQNFSVTTAGTYKVTLTVTDSNSPAGTATDVVTINVAENQAPTAVITHSLMLQEPFSWITSDANMGTDELLVLSGRPVSLSGLTSTDPNGFDFASNPTDSFTWSVTLNSVDVTSTSLIGTDGGRTTFSGSVVGTYTVELTVSDGLLSSSQAAALSITTAATFPPTVTIDPSGNQTVNLGTDLALTATGMDPDGDSTFTYAWTATSTDSDGNDNDVTRLVLTGANTATATFNSYASGEYSISVVATDDDGETSPSETVMVTVRQYVATDDDDDGDEPPVGGPLTPMPTDPEDKTRLAQLGRVLSQQVMDAVQDRLSASRVSGFSGTLAGQVLPTFGDDTKLPAYADSPQHEPAASFHGRSDRLHKETRSLTTQALLAGSQFSLTSGSMDDRSSAVWGHVSISNFEGAALNDSEMTTALLGADWVSNRLVSGLALSHSTGEGSWLTMGSIASSSENTITGLYPYFGYDVSDRMSVWGVIGYAQGEADTVFHVPNLPVAIVAGADLEMLMFAGGTANNLMSSASGDNLTVLSLKTDVVLAQSSAVDQLGETPEINADSSRLRLALEAAWQMPSSGGGQIKPSAEVGVRVDDGDADKGMGIDIGVGFGWHNPASGISTELRGRLLMTHESEDYSERSLSGSFAWDPSPGSAEGANLAVNYLLGGSTTGGVEALFAQDTISGIGMNGIQQNGRMEVRLGYGLPVLGGRFVGTPETSFGYSEDRRDVSLGWGMMLVDRSATGVKESFGLSVEARRRENANDGGFEDAIVFQLRTQF